MEQKEKKKVRVIEFQPIGRCDKCRDWEGCATMYLLMASSPHHHRRHHQQHQQRHSPVIDTGSLCAMIVVMECCRVGFATSNEWSMYLVYRMESDLKLKGRNAGIYLPCIDCRWIITKLSGIPVLQLIQVLFCDLFLGTRTFGKVETSWGELERFIY